MHTIITKENVHSLLQKKVLLSGSIAFSHKPIFVLVKNLELPLLVKRELGNVHTLFKGILLYDSCSAGSF